MVPFLHRLRMVLRLTPSISCRSYRSSTVCLSCSFNVSVSLSLFVFFAFIVFVLRFGLLYFLVRQLCNCFIKWGPVIAGLPVGICSGLRRRRLFLSNNQQQIRLFFGTCSGLLRYCLLSCRTWVQQYPKQTRRKPVKAGRQFGRLTFAQRFIGSSGQCTNRHNRARPIPAIPSQARLTTILYKLAPYCTREWLCPITRCSFGLLISRNIPNKGRLPEFLNP
jgi:hypothetical protein